jgi:hypothetical protein
MKCKVCSAKATWKLLWAGGRAIVFACGAHKDVVERRVLKNAHADIVGWRRAR